GGRARLRWSGRRGSGSHAASGPASGEATSRCRTMAVSRGERGETVSQAEGAVTEPQVTEAVESRAGRAPEEAVAVEAEADPVFGDGAMADAVVDGDADPEVGLGDIAA